MNPDTNELVRLVNIAESIGLKKKGFIPVPKSLDHAARVKLGKNKRAIVSKTSGGKLSRWAAKKRKERAIQAEMVALCNAYYS